MCTSEATTRNVEISVHSKFIPERSQPSEHRWFFGYQIRIANHGNGTVKLLNRHWIITDANGRVEEVRGPGVVGKQPTLSPGEAFDYTSFCPLQTPFGTMEGSYQMVSEDGEFFDVEIARFTLSQPLAVN